LQAENTYMRSQVEQVRKKLTEKTAGLREERDTEAEQTITKLRLQNSRLQAQLMQSEKQVKDVCFELSSVQEESRLLL